MAKKPEAASAPPVPKPAPSEDITLAGAIRKGFEALPEAQSPENRDATKALKKWIADTYPSLAESVESNSFGSTLATQRKKLTGDEGEGGHGASIRTVRTAPTVSTEPTFPEVLKARDLCQELKLTPEKLLGLLEEVAKFGDPAKLKKCLTYAQQLPPVK